MLRPYLNAIVAILLVCAVSYVLWIHYDRNRIQTEFNVYKGVVSDQIAQNKAEAAAEKKRQDEKFQSAQTSYESNVSKLNATLEWVRKHQAVPWSSPLPMASGSSGPVPTDTSHPTNTTDSAEITAGIRQTAFYSDAMSDTLQCSRLIEFIKRP
jgi:hypothetical protein